MPRARPAVPFVGCYSVKLTEAQRIKLIKLGGAAFIRERIEHAQLKDGPEPSSVRRSIGQKKARTKPGKETTADRF